VNEDLSPWMEMVRKHAKELIQLLTSNDADRASKKLLKDAKEPNITTALGKVIHQLNERLDKDKKKDKVKESNVSSGAENKEG
jgi:hypothetical protein